jgi:hypothetical protein
VETRTWQSVKAKGAGVEAAAAEGVGEEAVGWPSLMGCQRLDIDWSGRTHRQPGRRRMSSSRFRIGDGEGQF